MLIWALLLAQAEGTLEEGPGTERGRPPSCSPSWRRARSISANIFYIAGS